MNIVNITELIKMDSNSFSSEGSAWQWALDYAGLLPDQITGFAEKTGLSAFSIIDAIKTNCDQGRAVKDALVELERYADKHDEEFLEEYLKITAGHNLQAFINGVAESVNTPAIKTGFEKLDKALDGGLYEGLYMVGAITSLGKTTLVLQLADLMAQNGKDVLIISLEMARNELMAKSISRTTAELSVTDEKYGSAMNAKTARGITDGARYRDYKQDELKLINDSIDQYSKYADHIFVIEGIGDISVQGIREAVERHKTLTGNNPVVIVDYLQILFPYDARATEKINTDKAITELKRISRDYKTPVIGISAYSRARYNEKADMAAFKESGGIEYGSDVLIGLQYKGVGENNFDVDDAKKKNPRKIELVILKNRNGEAGQKIGYDYYPKFNWFRENDD